MRPYGAEQATPASRPTWRETLREVIFEADTPGGKAFDVILLGVILVSVVLVMLESVEDLQRAYGAWIDGAEWFITGLFSIEYLLRLACVPSPWRYARSFFGLVDLLAIVPTYLSLVFVGAQSLLVIRALRLLRAFRVLKLGQFLVEAHALSTALRSSVRKIVIFMGTVLTLVLIVGALMYLIEGPENGFTSIPQSVYWAIVTMTTVGYGDIAPATVAGQVLAAVVMIIGYSIIAIPTGIVTSELLERARQPVTTRVCRSCTSEGHEYDARHCKDCGELLEPRAS